MKAYRSVVAGLSLVMLSASAPARLDGQQADNQQHEQHHGGGKPTAESRQAIQLPAQPQNQRENMMARSKASAAQLDVLLKKMHAATGTAKIDAIEELLTALVEDRREHESMMGGMADKMSAKHGTGGQTAPVK